MEATYPNTLMQFRKTMLLALVTMFALTLVAASLCFTERTAEQRRLWSMVSSDFALEAETVELDESTFRTTAAVPQYRLLARPAAKASEAMAAPAAAAPAEATSFPSGQLYGVGRASTGTVGTGIVVDTYVHQLLSLNAFGGPLAGGIEHTMVTDSAGRLWITGLDSNNQYGDGTVSSSSATISLQSFGSGLVKDVAAGSYHSLVVTEDGKVWGAGEGTSGQLGDGRGVDTDWFLEVKVSDVRRIVSFNNDCYAITNAGQLFTFGQNSIGGLGVGTTTQVDTPTEVISSGVVDVAAGSDFALVLMENGSVMAMGTNNFGQFGDGTTDSSLTPKLVVASGVKAVTAGVNFSAFLMNDNTLRTVGQNSTGQLGAGDTVTHYTFYTHPYNDVVEISAGREHLLFIRANGALYGTGSSGNGQLGLGDFTQRPTPEVIVGSGVVDVWATALNSFWKTGLSLLSLEIQGLEYPYEGSDANYKLLAHWSDGKTSDVTQGNLVENSANASIALNSGVMTIGAGAAGEKIVITGSYFGQTVQKEIYVVSPPKGSALYGMGQNSYSQLGLDTTVDQNVPRNITTDKIVSMAAGRNHTIYVREDGAVYTAGGNAYGQLGTNDTVPRSTPIQISVPKPAVAVGAGDYHSLIVLRDGSVYTMGLNSTGQLGDGTQVDRKVPTKVIHEDVVQVDGGAGHSIFVKSNGSLWATGRGSEGQLGHGSVSGTDWPIRVVSSGVVFAACGQNHTTYIDDATQLRGFGDNTVGQLGLGGAIMVQLIPTTLVASNVDKVAVGDSHTVYITQNKEIFGSGQNVYGQLGDGTQTARTAFQQIGTYTSASEVAAGGHFTVFQDGNTIYGIGDNSRGQFGNGTWTSPNTSPVALPHSNWGNAGTGYGHLLFAQKAISSVSVHGLSKAYADKTANYECLLHWDNGDTEWITDSATWSEDNINTTIGTDGVMYIGSTMAGQSVNVTASYGGHIDLKTVSVVAYSFTSGTLYGAGDNSSYQLGDSTDSGAHASAYTVDTEVAKVASGNHHTLYMKIDGSVWAVGDNSNGQLGLGDTTARQTPVQVTTDAVDITAGDDFSMIVKADGSLYGMGLNLYGQLGTGDNNSKYVPTAILRSGVTAASAGRNHSMALRDGELWTMGDNNFGQLGVRSSGGSAPPVSGPTAASAIMGPIAQSNVPLKVDAGSVTSIAAGADHSLYVKSGALYAMGNNGDGQLGIGTNTTLEDYPIQVIAANVSSVAAGENHSFYFTDSNVLLGMGWNGNGQLGIGNTTSYNTPVVVDTDVVAVEAGQTHSLWTRSDGSMFAVGSNGYGQLAQGTTSSTEPSPFSVTVNNAIVVNGGGSQSFYIDAGPSVVSLAIAGLSSVNEMDTATYTCIATFSDSSTLDVTGSATWSVDTAASFTGNVLTAASVSSDTTAIITAVYGGQTDTHAVTIVDTTIYLTSLAITGSSTVNETDTATYTCTATFSDSSTVDVSGSATWSVDTAASFTGNVMTAASVSSNTSAIITAVYGGQSDTHPVTIVDTTIYLVGLTVTGPLNVPESTSANFTCTALFSDSSTADVSSSASWSIDTAGSFTANTLTAGAVPADTAAIVTAVYGGQNDTHNITVTNTVVPLTGIAIVGPTTVNESDTAAFRCIATFANGSTQNVTNAAAWAENSIYSTIGTNTGILTTSPVIGDWPVTIGASFGGFNVSHNASILDTAPMARVYVKWDASGANNGADWTHAFTSLQSAFLKVAAGGEIWVAAGTYRPTTGNNRFASFRLIANTSMYGGFAGGESTLAARNPSVNVTILSGDIGVASDRSDNSIHVVTGAANAHLEGFVIRDGNANILAQPPAAPAVCDDEDDAGEGISDEEAAIQQELTASATSFVYGDNEIGGGLVVLAQSGMTVTSCIFLSNRAVYGGGGACVRQASITFTSCTFNGNIGGKWGGGLFATINVTPTIADCTFNNNNAGMAGGALMTSGTASPDVDRTIFKSNASGRDGGAVICNFSTADFTNCEFWSNSAGEHGGALIVNDTTLTLNSCTLNRNSTSMFAGAVEANSSALTIVNSILWNNMAPTINEIRLRYGATLSSTYSCTDDTLMTGTGMIYTNPAFVDEATGDLNLPVSSPCVDTSSPVNPGVDITNNTRDANPDMGAREYNAGSGSGTVTGTGGGGTSTGSASYPSGDSGGCVLGAGATWLPMLLMLMMVVGQRFVRRK